MEDKDDLNWHEEASNPKLEERETTYGKGYGVPLHRNPTPNVVPIAVIEVTISGGLSGTRWWERLVLPGEDAAAMVASILATYDVHEDDIYADTISSLEVHTFKGDTEAERLECYQRWNNCFYFGDPPRGPWI